MALMRHLVMSLSNSSRSMFLSMSLISEIMSSWMSASKTAFLRQCVHCE